MGTREPSIRLGESVDIRPRGSPLVEVGERGERERVEGVVDHGGGRKRGQCGGGDGYKRGGILRGGVKSGDGWKEMTALRAAVPSYQTRHRYRRVIPRLHLKHARHVNSNFSPQLRSSFRFTFVPWVPS